MGAEFDDGKDDGALRTIGEVAKALDIKQHVLRYWEQQFPMLQPLKRSGGRRYYRTEDVALVEEINRLVNGEGYTLKGAKKALSGKGTKPAEKPAQDKQDAPVKETTTQPDTDFPQDGGVDAFFGRGKTEDATKPETGSQPSDAAAIDAPKVPSEVIAGLKSIRNRLAAALDA